MSDYGSDEFEDADDDENYENYENTSSTKQSSPQTSSEKYDSDDYEDTFEKEEEPSPTKPDSPSSLKPPQKSFSPKKHEEKTSSPTTATTSTSTSSNKVSSSSPVKYNNTSSKGTQWEHIDPEELEIGQRIGGGGFAIVYEGHWKGKHVALKTLFDPRVDDKLKQEFMDELHVMSSLSHPNCVNLMAANTRPPKLVIVMELCDRSMYQFLHQTKEPLSQELAMQMACDTASGLAYLHEQTPPIIHRDIKSMNLLLTINKTVKLCDYGLVTTKVTAAGTPSYMAPELLQSKPFNKTVDVYSYAIILYELFKREMPWVGYGAMEIRSMVLAGERPDIPTVDCPFLIRGMIRRCWDGDSTKRPDFGQILKELKTWEPPVNHIGLLDAGVGDSLDSLGGSFFKK
jgi:tRNA A-37 threonylcarbamoyl transferase component Bud32